jgi:long-chain acyl-CoA synthetase
MHPDVLEASVYALPDARLGEEVGATLYTQRAISEDDLRTFLIGHLAKFKIPRYFIMTTQPLLRIASGKIDKRLIRASAAQTHGLDS